MLVDLRRQERGVQDPRWATVRKENKMRSEETYQYDVNIGSDSPTVGFIAPTGLRRSGG
jgi:hypothetical protein